MKNRTSRIAQASIVFCFVFSSPMAMAGKPACPCDMEVAMDAWEDYFPGSSLQSCEVAVEKPEGGVVRRVARASYLKDGKTTSQVFSSAAFNSGSCIDPTIVGNLRSIEIKEYKACADDFIAECTARLD